MFPAVRGCGSRRCPGARRARPCRRGLVRGGGSGRWTCPCRPRPSRPRPRPSRQRRPWCPGCRCPRCYRRRSTPRTTSHRRLRRAPAARANRDRRPTAGWGRAHRGTDGSGQQVRGTPAREPHRPRDEMGAVRRRGGDVVEITVAPVEIERGTDGGAGRPEPLRSNLGHIESDLLREHEQGSVSRRGQRDRRSHGQRRRPRDLPARRDPVHVRRVRAGRRDQERRSGRRDRDRRDRVGVVSARAEAVRGATAQHHRSPVRPNEAGGTLRVVETVDAVHVDGRHGEEEPVGQRDRDWAPGRPRVGVVVAPQHLPGRSDRTRRSVEAVHEQVAVPTTPDHHARGTLGGHGEPARLAVRPVVARWSQPNRTHLRCAGRRAPGQRSAPAGQRRLRRRPSNDPPSGGR